MFSRTFLFPEILPRKIFKGLYETQEMAFLEISIAAMRQRMDTLIGGSLPEAVRALASESGASQSQLEQAIRVLEEQHQEAEEYDLYDPYG